VIEEWGGIGWLVTLTSWRVPFRGIIVMSTNMICNKSNVIVIEKWGRIGGDRMVGNFDKLESTFQSVYVIVSMISLRCRWTWFFQLNKESQYTEGKMQRCFTIIRFFGKYLIEKACMFFKTKEYLSLWHIPKLFLKFIDALTKINKIEIFRSPLIANK